MFVCFGGNVLGGTHTHTPSQPTPPPSPHPTKKGFDLGQDARDSYLRAGADGYHSLWDSRVPNYGGYETKRLLLGNLAWWIDEFKFDGFR
jgi:hypothetical protein